MAWKLEEGGHGRVGTRQVEGYCTSSTFLFNLLLCQFERVPDKLWRQNGMEWRCETDGLNKDAPTLAPSPMYICTSCGPANLMKMALVWLAHARARRVFPVPGGPCSSTPVHQTDLLNERRARPGGGVVGLYLHEYMMACVILERPPEKCLKT